MTNLAPKLTYALPDSTLEGALGRARSRGELLEMAEATLQRRWKPSAYTLTWLSGEQEQTLFAAGAVLARPDAADLGDIANFHPEQVNGPVYLPLQVAGITRGWLGLITKRRVSQELFEWAQQLAALLVVYELPRELPPDQQRDSPISSREMALLNEAGPMIRGTLSLQEILEKLADLVSKNIEASELAIALLDEETDQLRFVYATNLPGIPPLTRAWHRAEGLTGVVLRSGRPFRTESYMQACRDHHVEPILVPGAPVVHAWLGVPLVHQDRALGVMVVSTRSPETRYTAADERFMVMVADQAASAVANAHLFAKVERQAQQLRLINQIGRTISSTLDPRELPMLLAQELSRVLDVEDIVVLVETAGGELEVRYDRLNQSLHGTRLPMATSLAGQTLRSGRIQHVDVEDESPWWFAPIDEAGGVRSRCLLCVPVHGPRTRGVIELRNKRGGHFNEDDAALLAAVAEQAAISLHNAERYSETDQALADQLQQLEQRNRQLLNLVTLANALQSADSLAAVADEIAAAVAQLVTSGRALVALLSLDQESVDTYATRGFTPDASGALPQKLAISAVLTLVSQSVALDTFTFHIGEHPLLPGFVDAVLLTVRDRKDNLIGMIVVDVGEQASALDANAIRALEIVANQVAIAVAHVALRDQQQHTVDRLTALNAVGLVLNNADLDVPQVAQMMLGGAVGTTGSVGGGVTIDGADGIASTVVLGLPATIGTVIGRDNIGSADYVMLKGEDLPVVAQALDLASLLVVPLRGTKLTVGALWLGFGEETIAQDERETAVLYAKMAGAVIENMNLFAAVRAARDRMAAILASTREGMLMVDQGGTVSVANSAWGALFWVDQVQLVGRDIDQLCVEPARLGLPDTASHSVCEAIHAVLAGTDEQPNGEFVQMGKEAMHLAWTVLPVYGDAGRPAGALLVARDVTADRQIEKLRQDLASMIVHDLRSPLTNLMISIDLLLKQQHGRLSSDQIRILAIAADSCQQMLDLVNTLLDIRRLEARTLELHQQSTFIAAIVDGVIERLERVAADRGVHLRNLLPATVSAHIDLDMVRRVLQNLLDNALKFSPRNGVVTVTGEIVDAEALPRPHMPGAWLLLSIADQGPGIPAAFQPLLFQLFSQAPGGRGRGTGLGLAFCKLAVEAHGGAIWYDGDTDKGATFRLTLPVAGTSTEEG